MEQIIYFLVWAALFYFMMGEMGTGYFFTIKEPTMTDIMEYISLSPERLFRDAILDARIEWPNIIICSGQE